MNIEQQLEEWGDFVRQYGWLLVAGGIIIVLIILVKGKVTQ